MTTRLLLGPEVSFPCLLVYLVTPISQPRNSVAAAQPFRNTNKYCNPQQYSPPILPILEMESPSFDSSTAFELTNDVKLPLTDLGAPKSLKRLIPPTTYQLQHDDWSNAQIWALSSSSSSVNHLRKSSSLIIDASPTFNPIAAVNRSSNSDLNNGSTSGEHFGFHIIDPVVIPPTHCIKKVTGRTFALFEGLGDHEEYSHARKVMDFQTERAAASPVWNKQCNPLTKLFVF